VASGPGKLTGNGVGEKKKKLNATAEAPREDEADAEKNNEMMNKKPTKRISSRRLSHPPRRLGSLR